MSTLLLLLLLAQVVGPDKPLEQNSPIEYRVDMSEIDSEISIETVTTDWKFDKATNYRAIDDNGIAVHCWSLPGDHVGEVVIAYPKNGKTIIKRIELLHTVKGATDIQPDSPPPPQDLKSLIKGEDLVNLSQLLMAIQQQAEFFKSVEQILFVYDTRIGQLALANNAAVKIIRARIESTKSTTTALVKIAEALKELGVSKVAAITYVYEKDNTAPPSFVDVMLNKLNREKDIKATMLEDPTNNENGRLAKQYEKTLPAAKEVGLPAAVAEYTDGKTKAIKNPTADQIWSLAP
jgi:hypothetical protein